MIGTVHNENTCVRGWFSCLACSSCSALCINRCGWCSGLHFLLRSNTSHHVTRRRTKRSLKHRPLPQTHTLCTACLPACPAVLYVTLTVYLGSQHTIIPPANHPNNNISHFTLASSPLWSCCNCFGRKWRQHSLVKVFFALWIGARWENQGTFLLFYIFLIGIYLLVLFLWI